MRLQSNSPSLQAYDTWLAEGRQAVGHGLAELDAALAQRTPGEPVALFFGSGTTAPPKAMVHSHAGLIDRASHAVGNALICDPLRDVIGLSQLRLGVFVSIGLEAVGNWTDRQGISFTGHADPAKVDEVCALVSRCIGQADAEPATDPSLGRARVHDFLVINGIHRPQEGRIGFRGEQLSEMTPNRAARLGMSRTFQNIAHFKGMTVLDNSSAGCTLREHASFLEVALQLPRARREEEANRAKGEGIIEFLQVEPIRKTPVKCLPCGLQ